ncbi:hypothetical protein R3P38DRAFT_2584601 [Favolaschia claudopus]|uniref:Uncharacterized protein n=1 Tax=Favolaschia claudopus TaxID=2862362 RepID=A0AAV9Z6W4_9AGAR
MADIPMPQGHNAHFIGPILPPTIGLGWTKEQVRANHTQYNLDRMDAHPEATLVAVLLSNCFVDRSTGPDAIRHILAADLVDVLSAVPRIIKADTNSFPLGKPWTHPITGCTDAFIADVAAKNGLFIGVYANHPVAFYCIPADPRAPHLVLTFNNLPRCTEAADVYHGLLTALTNDQTVLDIIASSHSNIPGNHTPQELLTIMFDAASILFFDVHRRINGQSYEVPAVRIILPPFDLDSNVNLRLHKHIMTASYFFDVPGRGLATAWLGTGGSKLMECGKCRGTDHYEDACPITTSEKYRAIFGIPADAPDDNDNDNAATSSTLAFTPTPAAPPPQATSNRGGGRGNSRGTGGGRGGYGSTRGGGGGRGRGAYRGGHGYAPYYY